MMRVAASGTLRISGWNAFGNGNQPRIPRQSFGTASPPNLVSVRTIWGDSTNQCQAEAIEDNRSTLFGAI